MQTWLHVVLEHVKSIFLEYTTSVPNREAVDGFFWPSSPGQEQNNGLCVLCASVVKKKPNCPKVQDNPACILL